MEIPKIGFGTYRLRGKTVYKSVLYALSEGYRHFDTANLYGNESEIGKAIKKSGVPREEIWITTKIQMKDIGKGEEAMCKSFMNSCEQFEYIDLLLLHGPVEEKLIESWTIMEGFIKTGKLRYIGVSNYNISHLSIILQNCKIVPYVNQFETNPYLKRDDLISYCQEKGIKVVAHTSLVKGEKFNDDKLISLSQQHNISKPSLLLSWALYKGMVVLPRSSNEEHIKENKTHIPLPESVIEALDNFKDFHCTHPKYIF